LWIQTTDGDDECITKNGYNEDNDDDVFNDVTIRRNDGGWSDKKLVVLVTKDIFSYLLAQEEN
jgi:hypothetical protein